MLPAAAGADAVERLPHLQSGAAQPRLRNTLSDTLLNAALEAVATRGGLLAEEQLKRVCELLVLHDDPHASFRQAPRRLPREFRHDWRSNLARALRAQPGPLAPVGPLLAAATCEVLHSPGTPPDPLSAELPRLVFQRNGVSVVRTHPDILRGAPLSCLAGLDDAAVRQVLDEANELGHDFGPASPTWGDDLRQLTPAAARLVVDRYSSAVRQRLSESNGHLLGAALLRSVQGMEEHRREAAKHLLGLFSLHELGDTSEALSLLHLAAVYNDDLLCEQIVLQGFLSDDDIMTVVGPWTLCSTGMTFRDTHSTWSAWRALQPLAGRCLSRPAELGNPVPGDRVGGVLCLSARNGGRRAGACAGQPSRRPAPAALALTSSSSGVLRPGRERVQ